MDGMVSRVSRWCSLYARLQPIMIVLLASTWGYGMLYSRDRFLGFRIQVILPGLRFVAYRELVNGVRCCPELLALWHLCDGLYDVKRMGSGDLMNFRSPSHRGGSHGRCGGRFSVFTPF
ncbi:hypothetical protein F4861DRAFT_318318 [Xylaria intraflava]|nr:hypothetical protein F4861DRAFT_318318 [Xylaria intraflava]